MTNHDKATHEELLARLDKWHDEDCTLLIEPDKGKECDCTYVIRQHSAAAIRDLQAKLEAERELQTMQIAGISTACLMNTRHGDAPLAKDHPYWTPAYQDAIEAVGREMRERERAEAAEQTLAKTRQALKVLIEVADSGRAVFPSEAIRALTQEPAETSAQTQPKVTPEGLAEARKVLGDFPL